MNHFESGHRSVLVELIAGYRPGFSMDASFYTSEAVYRADLEMIFCRNWIYAGHVSQVPDPGCYILVEPGVESVIVVRGNDDTVRAFANVCRHRGSRICTEAAGKVKAFVCPYHAWAYGLDGRLRSRRAMPGDFDPSRYGLKAVRCEVFHGLIFVNLDGNAPGLVESIAEMDSSFEPYQLENTRLACRQTYSVQANWKLAVENFMECYHCAPAHTEYARCHALKSPRDNEVLRPDMLKDAERLGYATDTIDKSLPAGKGQPPYYYARNALYEPFVTGSRDGGAVAPLLGRIRGYGGGAADIQIGPVSYGILYPDHAVLYRFLPRGVQGTDMDIFWLVEQGAKEGRDYDLEQLTWMWRVTTEADKNIISYNQQGVNSRFYEPGPLSEMEDFMSGFIQWYLVQIG